MPFLQEAKQIAEEMRNEEAGDFFFTFGSQSQNRDKYVRITASNRDAARETMFREHGANWSMSYNAEQFKGQPEEYGLTELAHYTERK